MSAEQNHARLIEIKDVASDRWYERPVLIALHLNESQTWQMNLSREEAAALRDQLTEFLKP